MLEKLTIKDEQKLQLEMLAYVDEICKKEEITYYMAFGSLIGAARENGFIDWDDDIDIWMDKESYDRFSERVCNYPDSRFFYQSTDTDIGFGNPAISRICVNGTNKWSNEAYNTVSFHKGVFLDIFRLDYACEADWLNKIENNVCHILQLALCSKKVRVRYMDSINARIVWFIGSIFSKKILVSLHNLILKIGRKDQSTLRCIGSPYNWKKNCFQRNWFEETIHLSFEEQKVCCPKEYDTILSHIYGDWRTPTKTKHYYNDAYIEI